MSSATTCACDCSTEKGAVAHAAHVFNTFMTDRAAALPAPAPGESPEAAAARVEERRLLIASATAAGIAPVALSDFIRRCEDEMPRTPSAVDPTRPHADLGEFIETLRHGAPHLFATAKTAGAGNGRADPWE